jgi:hypothetical protein
MPPRIAAAALVFRHRFTVCAIEHVRSGESHMRALLTAAIAAIAGASLTPAQAADNLPPAYGNAPPPAYAPPPPAYGYAPPVYAPASPYRVPPGYVVAPEGPVYAVPAPNYQAGDEYEANEVLVDNRRYYRDCWWEWGFRRCALKPRWW